MLKKRSNNINHSDTYINSLSIADAIKDPPLPPANRTVLLGRTQLKIQIPCLGPTMTEPLQSPIEFGVKNKNAQLAMLSPMVRSPAGTKKSMLRSLSAKEMEMSDDYTCVIAHGPNPKTIRIFDDYVISDDGDIVCAGCKKNICGCECRYREESEPELTTIL